MTHPVKYFNILLTAVLMAKYAENVANVNKKKTNFDVWLCCLSSCENLWSLTEPVERHSVTKRAFKSEHLAYHTCRRESQTSWII